MCALKVSILNIWGKMQSNAKNVLLKQPQAQKSNFKQPQATKKGITIYLTSNRKMSYLSSLNMLFFYIKIKSFNSSFHLYTVSLTVPSNRKVI